MKSKKELAEKLGITEKQLNFYAYKLPESDKYFEFQIKKRNGDPRTIHSPNIVLKKIQRGLCEVLAENYEPLAPPCVHGFRKDRSHITNAGAHLKKRILIKLDLKDYFPTITGGMVVNTLISFPFLYNKEVARTIASLCTRNGVLPQGSPTSPILANMVTRTLDIKLINLAKRLRCTYTRHADDITFSFSSENLSKLLAKTEDGQIELSTEIIEEITNKGFLINHDKIRYRKWSNRQMVTGIITNNKKINLKREYLKETKLLIHISLKYGKEAAKESYFRKYPNNRYGYRENFDIVSTIRGRMEYIKYVRGEDDPVYLSLVDKYLRLNPNYKVTYRPIPSDKDKIIIFCEGETDYKHLEMALEYFQNNGYFTSLKLELTDKKIKGWDGLKKKFDNMIGSRLLNKHVAIFDSDVPELFKDYPPNTCKKIDDNLFVVVIPTPEHLADGERFCIEMLYKKQDFQRKDSNGRRIYLSQEFNKTTGMHLSERVFTAPISGNKLVIDSNVFSLDNPTDSTATVSLSKNHFAGLIQENRQTVDFSGFKKLFEYLRDIQDGVVR